MIHIIYNEHTKEFHLQNDRISYILGILENGQLGHIYFGKRIQHRDSFQHLIQMRSLSHTAYVYENDYLFSLDILRQEYPSYGTTDFREPAYQTQQENGSRITGFTYKSHRISAGKKPLTGLPAIYAENEQEVLTLEIVLEDELIGTELTLSYSIFEAYDAVCRNARFINLGSQNLQLKRAMSMSLDLYDSEFQMLQLDGAWSRERHITERKLTKGIQSISSARGASSSNHNPFLVLKRPVTDEL